MLDGSNHELVPNASLEIPLDQLISGVNLLFSAAAALVGFVILWFTVFKGADIDLVPVHLSLERPDIYPDYPLDTIGLNPIEMVFVNSGSRSGAVVEINADFKPSKSFSRFYKGLRQNVEIKSPATETNKQLPVIIPDRGTAIVTVRPTIELKPWKDLSRLVALTTMPLGDALKLIWKEGRESLAEFSKFKENLGMLELRVRRTRRYRLRIQVREDIVASGLSVGELPEWARIQGRASLNSFSMLRKSDGQMARDIRHIPELFMKDYHQNVSVLSPGNIGEMKQLQASAYGEVYSWERWFDNPIRYALAHEREFKEKMEAYYQQLTQYNERVQAIAPGTPLEAPEMRALETFREELRKKVKDFHDELLKLREKLVAETAHLLSSQ